MTCSPTLWNINPFDPTDLFLYPLQTLQNPWLSDVFEGQRKASGTPVGIYLLKVNNRDAIGVILESLLLTLNIFHTKCSSVFIVNFEHISADWDEWIKLNLTNCNCN